MHKNSFPKVIEEDGFNEYPVEEIMTSLGKYLVENNDVAANLYKKCNDSTSETERHLISRNYLNSYLSHG